MLFLNYVRWANFSADGVSKSHIFCLVVRAVVLAAWEREIRPFVQSSSKKLDVFLSYSNFLCYSVLLCRVISCDLADIDSLMRRIIWTLAVGSRVSENSDPQPCPFIYSPSLFNLVSLLRACVIGLASHCRPHMTVTPDLLQARTQGFHQVWQLHHINTVSHCFDGASHFRWNLTLHISILICMGYVSLL